MSDSKLVNDDKEQLLLENLRVENKEPLESFLGSKILKFFKEDPTTKIAVCTAIITAGSFILKLLGYIRLKGYLSIFSIPIENIDYAFNRGLTDYFFTALIFIGLAIPSALFYMLFELIFNRYQLYKLCKKIGTDKYSEVKKEINEKSGGLRRLFLAILSYTGVINVFLYMLSATPKAINSMNIKNWALSIGIFWGIEMLSAIVVLVSNKRNETKKTQVKESENQTDFKKRNSKRPIYINLFTSSVIVILFAYSSLAYISGILQAKGKEIFPVVNGEYAVIYQDNNYFWSVKATIEKNTLILDTATQKVIEVSNIEYTQRSFDDVIICYLQ